MAPSCSRTCASASKSIRCSTIRRSALTRSSSSATACARARLGQDQLEPRVGALQAAGGVDARRQPEADGAGVEPRGVAARDRHERPQPGLARGAQRVQALAHQPAVLAAQRHDVGDRRQRHEVEVLGGGRRAQRGDELVGDGGGAEVRARVAADRRVHDRRVRQRAVGARRVVVGDQDVDARGARLGDLLDGRDRAVGGDEQLRARGGQARDRVRTQPVAVLEPAREIPVHLGAEGAQRAHEDRRRADPVDVVVAVDGDPRAGGDVPAHERERVVETGEPGRRMRLVGGQPRARRVGVGEPAPDEHLRGDVAEAELRLEARDGLRRAGCDLDATGGGHRPRNATSATGRDRRGA
ncbi:MAG TPA: hypothetical protein VFR97_10825 [Capillimicrobium sp.]|nr:hypothetical protein [Capillimicrobium sp.]